MTVLWRTGIADSDPNAKPNVRPHQVGYDQKENGASYLAFAQQLHCM
jgi:hypothetical protein